MNPMIRWLLMTSLASIAATASTGGRAIAQQPVEPRSTLNEYLDVVWCVAFSPDGKSMATTSGNRDAKAGELRGYDIRSGEPVKTFSIAESRGIRWAAYAPDGKTLATGEYDGMVKIRDAATGKVIDRFEAHRDGVQCLKFTRDGKTLVTCGKDKTAKAWDVATRKLKATMTGHANHVYSLDLSKDDKTLLTGGNEAPAYLWNVATGEQEGTIPGNDHPVEVVRFSPGGSFFAVAGWDGVVNVWDAATDTRIQRLGSPGGGILALAFSPDGKHIVAGTELGLAPRSGARRAGERRARSRRTRQGRCDRVLSRWQADGDGELRQDRQALGHAIGDRLEIRALRMTLVDQRLDGMPAFRGQGAAGFVRFVVISSPAIIVQERGSPCAPGKRSCFSIGSGSR